MKSKWGHFHNIQGYGSFNSQHEDPQSFRGSFYEVHAIHLRTRGDCGANVVRLGKGGKSYATRTQSLGQKLKYGIVVFGV